MAGTVEDLYETILGRQGDAAGLAGWQAQLDSGAMNYDQVTQGFLNSQEYQSQLAGFASVASDLRAASIPALDLGTNSWSDLVTQAHDAYSVSKANSNPDAGVEAAWSLPGVNYGISALYGSNPLNSTGWNHDEGALSGFIIQGGDASHYGFNRLITANSDGTIKQSLVEMPRALSLIDKLIKTVTDVGVAYVASAVGGAMLGTSSGGAAGASTEASAGDTIATGMAESGGDAAMTYEESAAIAENVGTEGTVMSSSQVASSVSSDFPGLSNYNFGTTGTGQLGSGTYGVVEPGTVTTMAQAGETVSPELLGTGYASAITPAAAIPGIDYTLGGSIMAGTPGTLSTAQGLGSAATNFTNMGTGLTPLNGGNWWDKLVNNIKQIPSETKSLMNDAGISATDLLKLGTAATGLAAINKSSSSGAVNTPPALNFPTSGSSSGSSGGPLSLSASQRAGVMFGHTKSKYELRGKFSGTGIKIK